MSNIVLRIPVRPLIDIFFLSFRRLVQADKFPPGIEYLLPLPAIITTSKESKKHNHDNSTKQQVDFFFQFLYLPFLNFIKEISLFNQNIKFKDLFPMIPVIKV
jgi:hypothetical protein